MAKPKNTRKRGGTKFPILDPDFKKKMLGSAETAEERGLIRILAVSGMHISSVMSLMGENIITIGDKKKLSWNRPKTHRYMEVTIPRRDLDEIVQFTKLTKRQRKSQSWYYRRIGAIAKDAGYDKVSSMTFRHTKCVDLLRKGWDMVFVADFLGCTVDVVRRNYSKMQAEQLYEMEEKAAADEDAAEIAVAQGQTILKETEYGSDERIVVRVPDGDPKGVE